MFPLFCSNFFTLSSEIKLNLFRISHALCACESMSLPFVKTLMTGTYDHRRTGPFPFGGAQNFLPEFLIFARKVE